MREELGQLEGRAYKPSVHFVYYQSDVPAERAKVEWIVRAPQGGLVTLTARHERAGTIVTSVALESAEA